MATEAIAIPTSRPVGPDAQHRDDSEPPNWLVFVVLATAGGVLTFGLVGLVLAINGWYRPLFVFPLGALAWAGLLALARPLYTGGGGAAAPTHWFAAAGVALVLAVTAWNVANISQHVLINRDGGSYANTGRWIARDGSLDVEPRVGPFATEPSLDFDSFAVYEMPDGSLQFQFSHLLPVVLAEAHSVAGDRGLFRVPPVLGGIALLAFFVLTWRLTRRPLVAILAMLALAFIIPQVSYSRDTYSEIPSQILLFASVAALTSTRVVPRWRGAFVGGLFLGAIEATRIDSIAYLIGIPVLLAVAWLRAAPEDRRETGRAIGAFVAGLVPGLLIGLVDLTRHAGGYFDDLASKERLLVLATVGSAVVSGLAVLVWPRVSPHARKLPWRAIATAAGVAVAAFGYAMWAFRPQFQTVRAAKSLGLVAGLQQAEGHMADATRRYFEFSMQWMWWYLGKVTLAAAIAGAGVVVYRVLLGRGTRLLALLCIMVVPSGMYLWTARAAPDHVWVTRRFLVGAFPLLILLAFLLVVSLWSVPPGRWMVLARALAVTICVFAVAHPLYTLRDVRRMTEQYGFLGVVQEACGVIGDDAAVLVLETNDEAKQPLFDDWIPQALRGWCGAEVAVLRERAQPEMIERLAREWEAEGRRLVLVAAAPETILAAAPGAEVTTTHEARHGRFLVPTLTHRPDMLREQSFAMVVAPVPS